MRKVKPFKQACTCYLILILLIFFITPKTNAQISTLDSLKQMLDFFEKNISDGSVKSATKDAKASLKNNIAADTLIVKLFALENTLFRTEEINKKTVLQFFLLVNHFIEQQPETKWETLSEDLNNRAFLYITMGLAQTGIELYQEALAVTKKAVGENHIYYYSILTNLAYVWENMAFYNRADSAFKRVLVIIENVSGTQTYDYAAALNNLAGLYKDISLYKEALPLYSRAISIMKETIGDKNPSYAVCLNNLALIYQELGVYKKALPLYKEGLLIIKETHGENYSDYTTVLNNLARLYKETGDFHNALSLYKQVLSIDSAGMGKETSEYARSLNNLADLYLDMKLYMQANQVFREVLSIQKKIIGNTHPDFATTLNGLANVYFAEGNLVEADSLYQQALIIKRNALGEQHPDYIENLQDIGLVSACSGRYQNAIDSIAKACRLRLQNITSNISTLSEEEMLALSNVEQSNFGVLPSVLLMKNTKDPQILKQLYNTELVLKGMVLQNQQNILSSIRESGDSAILALYEEWRINKKIVGKQLLLPVNNRLTRLDSLQNLVSDEEEKLSRGSTSFNDQQKNQFITVNEIAQRLIKEHAASIEFIRFQLYNKKWTDSFMYAALMLLPGDSIVKYIPLCEERQLQHLLLSRGFEYVDINTVSAYRGSSDNQPGSTNDSLYLVIWKPLEKYLSGIYKIYYAPAGLLNRVSFQALKTDAVYLLDKYQLNLVLSTRSVAFPEKESIKPVSANIWGSIQYNFADGSKTFAVMQKDSPIANLYAAGITQMRGKEFESLPGALDELRTLQDIFQYAHITVSIDSGAAATEEKFKTLDGRSPQILHLATHGFFLPADTLADASITHPGQHTFSIQQNPMFRSGLALAGANYIWKENTFLPGREDGILTAYEIAQMDLTHTDIAVLSACETALGDIEGNEGVIGLQRALKLAGVKQIIMSLWRVPDKETRELMIIFYTNWLNGEAPAEALRSAQQKMKEKYPFAYWAAFVLVE